MKRLAGRPSLRFVVLFGSALFLACAARGPVQAPGFEAPRPRDVLEIRLVFGEEADLDLFVSDPRQEALYFGNNPTLGGAALDVDRRCDAPAPRTEIARFPTARAGRYRVGVSYDRPCGFRGVPAPFEVFVEGDSISITQNGIVSPGEFEHVVLEFEFSPPQSPPSSD